MDNGISRRQNEEQSLRRLAAKRHFYSRAKTVARVQFIVAVCIPIGLLILDVYRPASRLWIAFAGLLLTLIDDVVLNKWKSSLREKAAKIQEAFDVYVLELDWSDLVGRRVDREELLSRAVLEADQAKLTDWYTDLKGSVPLTQARIICQRANCVWDSKQRRVYGIATLVLAATVMVALVCWSLQRELSLPNFVLSILAPAFPFLMWSIRQRNEHYEAANQLEQMCQFGDRLWTATLEQTMSDEQLKSESRRLQDAIFQHRASSPLVSEWFYNILRSRFQHTLNMSTAEMVEEAERHRR